MNLKVILHYALGPIAGAVIGILTLPVLAWFFGPDDLGRMAMLQIAITLSALVIGLGLDQAFVREYHEAAQKASLLLVACAFSGLTYAAFAVIVIFGGVPLSGWLFGVDLPLYDNLFFALLAATLIAGFLRLRLRMEERGLVYSISQIWPKALFIVSVVIASLFDTARDFGLLYSIYTICFSSVVLVLFWMNRDLLNELPRARVKRAEVSRMLAYGLPLALSGATYWGLSAIDRVGLRFLSDFDEVGVYSVAVTLASGVSIVGSVFSTVWSPLVYKWVANRDDLSRVESISDIMLAAVIFIFCLVGISSEMVAMVFPQSYKSLQWLLLPCLASPLFYMLSEAVAIGIGVTRKSHFTIWITLAAFLLNFVGNLILIPKFGASGAAVSTAISFWFYFVFKAEVSSRIWRAFSRSKFYVWTGGCAVAVSFIAIAGQHLGIADEAFWCLVLMASIFYFKDEYATARVWLYKHLHTLRWPKLCSRD